MDELFLWPTGKIMPLRTHSDGWPPCAFGGSTSPLPERKRKKRSVTRPRLNSADRCPQHACCGHQISVLDTFIDNFALTPEQFRDEVNADFDVSAENLREKLASKEYSIPALNVFRQNPLLRLNDEEILIMDLRFVADMMTSQIHWYLFNQTADKQRGTFRTLWGYLFELYVVGMFRWFYPEASKLLTVDAGYSGGQIDAFLDFGREVFLFEIKASLLTQPAKRGGSLSDFEADVRKKFLSKEGIPQLVNSCAALKSGAVKTNIQSPVIFPIMVVDEPA